MDHSADPISPGGTEAPAKLHNLAFERQTLRETVFIFWEKKCICLVRELLRLKVSGRHPFPPEQGLYRVAESQVREWDLKMVSLQVL